MQDQVRNQNKGIIIFLLLTFSLSSIFYYLIIQAGSLKAGGGLYTLGLMWCPGIAAIISLTILGRSLKELGWKWGASKWQVRSYLIPIMYSFIAYFIIWILAFGKFYDTEFVSKIASNIGMEGRNDALVILIYVLLEGSLAFLIGAIFALGEEIGWRGFLLPEFYKKYGFTKSSLMVGLIWGIWHLPILFFADYNSLAPTWYSMLCFMLLVVSASFIYTWFRIKSGSLWTAVILHASHNVFIQSIFTPLTVDTGNTAYFIDEFGIVLPVVVMCFAFYFWLGRTKLENSSA